MSKKHGTLGPVGYLLSCGHYVDANEKRNNAVQSQRIANGMPCPHGEGRMFIIRTIDEKEENS